MISYVVSAAFRAYAHLYGGRNNTRGANTQRRNTVKIEHRHAPVCLCGVRGMSAQAA